MAKVEQTSSSKSDEGTPRKSNKKRKNKDVIDTVELSSGKFKKIDINDNKSLKTRKIDKRMTSPSKVTKSVSNKQNIKKRKHSDSDDDNNEEDIRQPTVAEISQSKLPENMLKIKTKRQQKRQKHQELSETKQQSNHDRELQRNYDYLHKWTHNRSEWKFEKLRQISIQNNMFNETIIDDELWIMTKEYLCGTKGSARLAIIKNAESIICNLDEKIMNSNDNDAATNLTQSKNYERAREMLQFLQ